MGVTIRVGSEFDSAGIDRARRELDKLQEKTKTTSSKISKASGAIAASMAAVGTTIAGYAVVQVNKLEESQVQLENAFKNSGTSVEDHGAQLSKVRDQMEKFGYTNAETNDAIARMTSVTGNAQKSMDNMGLAADIAKNRHIDLSKSVDLMAKAMAGNTGAAKRMGIAIPDSIKNIQDPVEKSNAILGILRDRFKGSADAAANTFGGKMDAAKAKIGDAAASIGSKLIPIVIALVDKMMALGKWISQHKEVMIGILVAIGLALGAMAVMWLVNTIAAMSFWTAATGGIIILVAALTAAIIWIVNHWGAVWKFIKDIAADAWHWIYNHVVHPIVRAFQVAWGAVKGAFVKVWDWLSSAWSTIYTIVTTPIDLAIGFVTQAWNGIVDFFKTSIDTIGNVFGQIGNAILAPFKLVFNAIAHIWNNTVGKLHWKAPWWLGGWEISVPQIPEWKAAGGSVMGGKPYLVGEQGPELFMPLSSGTIVPNHRLGGGGGQVVNHVTINVSNPDPQAVVNTLRKWIQRNGSLAGAGVK